MLLVLSVPELNYKYSPSKDSEEFCHIKTNELVASSEEYDQLLIISNALVTFSYLSKVLKCLKPHSKISIKYVKGGESVISSTEAETEMKLCGLISVVVNACEGDELFEISGNKPNSSQGVRRPQKSKDVLKSIISAPTDSASVRLLDDSDLLKDEDLVRNSPNESAEECGPQAKKKACKNCSCGLKEVEEQAQQLTSEPVVVDTANAKSSCGSVRIQKITFLIYLIVFSVIWAMRSDVVDVLTEDFQLLNPESKLNYHLLCSMTTWIFRFSLINLKCIQEKTC